MAAGSWPRRTGERALTRYRRDSARFGWGLTAFPVVRGEFGWHIGTTQAPLPQVLGPTR